MTQELERVKLQRELIAVRKRLEKVRERLNQTQDAEEAADCHVLVELHQRHEKYLEAEIKLPGLRREMEEFDAASLRNEESILQRERARAKQVYPLPPLWPSPFGTGRRGHPEAIGDEIRIAEKAIHDWQQRLPEWKETYEYVMANFRARGVTPPDQAPAPEDKPPAQFSPEIWQGTVRTFGDFVLKEYREGRIPEANSKNKAVEIMCSHYVQRNGNPLKPASVLQNLRNRRAEGK